MRHLNNSNPEPPNTLLPLYRGTGFRGGIQGIGEASLARARLALQYRRFFTMSKIPRHIIDDILETAKIEEVIGDFIDLNKKGVRYLGRCPFHDDRHLGSFVVYPKGNCYKCFSCGAKGGVVDFLMNHEKLSYPDAIRWLGKKYNIETDMQDFNYTPPPRPKPEPLPMLVLPKYIMASTLLNVEQSTLVRWIRTNIRWDTVQRKRIDEVLNHYAVGCSRQGMTVFWQMDEQGRLRTGKMMRYREDGHRDRSQGYNFDWIHAALCRTRKTYDSEGNIIAEGPLPHPELYNPDKQEMMSCYFGLHLLDKYRRKDIDQTVCIVESEKTALLMAIAYGNHTNQVWMACGGLENINRDKLAPIIEQRRRIILYPDRDGIDKWRIKAEQLHYDRVIVDTTPVTKWWLPRDGEKADIADVVIRCINESQPLTNIKSVEDSMPQAKQLIDKLNLEIENNDRRTDTNEQRRDGDRGMQGASGVDSLAQFDCAEPRRCGERLTKDVPTLHYRNGEADNRTISRDACAVKHDEGRC